MEDNLIYEIDPLLFAEPYVGEDGIYGVNDLNPCFNKLIITKEQFIEAYNKWIATPND